MVFEVARFHDLVAYRLGRYYSAVNLAVYFFSFSGIYVDSAQSKMKSRFQHIAVREKPEYCLLTHYHEDHAGNAAFLKRKCGTKIFCHEKSKKYLIKPFRMLPYEKIIWGDFEAFEPDFIYSGKLDLNKLSFDVVYTPGHSEDSVCLLEKNRGWLFTGDLYVSSKVKYLRRDENIYKILASLKKLLKLDFDVMFCAHKGIVENSPKRHIEEKIEYIEELIYKACFMRDKGMSTSKIRDMLLGREDFISYLTFFDFCKLNLVESIFNDSRYN